MNDLTNITKIAKLLGEENEQRLKNTIVDILVEHVRDELRDFDMYLIDYENVFAEIEDEIKAAFKEKCMKMYMEKMDKKFAELFEKHFED